VKKIFLLLLIVPYLLAIQCFDDECALIENWEQNSFVPLVNITPIQSIYSAGDTLSISASIPSSNDFFDTPVNLLEESSDETGLLQLIAV
jgi:hypothetical protein